ncbi:MAG: hypothetical protein V1929_04785 [bacterium]
MMRIYQVLMGCAAVALGLLCAWQRDQLRASASRPHARESMIAAARPSVPEPTVAPVQRPAVSNAIPVAKPAPAPEPDDILVGDMLDDPERLEQIRALASEEIDTLYAQLFRTMRMTPDEISRLKDMIIARKIVEIEASLRLGEARTSAERDRIAAQQKRGMAAVDAKMRDFLGAEGYAVYQGYGKSMPERAMLADYRQYLDNRGEALTYDQEDGLIRLMYDERTRSRVVEALFSRSDTVSMRALGKPGEILLEFDAWQNRVRAKAAPLLSAHQNAVFEEQLVYQRDALTNFLGDVSY